MTQPGWYTDPADATTSRFWTGSAWSASRQWNGNQWIEVPVAPMVANPYPAAYPTAYSAAYPYPVAAPGVAGPMPIQRPDRRATNRAYLAIAGAALVVIGCLLPWAMEDTGFGTVGIKGTSAGGGQFDLVLGLAVIVLTVLFLAGRTGWKSSVLSLTLTVLIVVVCIANMVDISRTIDKEKASDTTALIGSSSSTTVGIGIILVLVGGCIAAVAVLLTMVGKRGHGRR